MIFSWSFITRIRHVACPYLIAGIACILNCFIEAIKSTWWISIETFSWSVNTNRILWKFLTFFMFKNKRTENKIWIVYESLLFLDWKYLAFSQWLFASTIKVIASIICLTSKTIVIKGNELTRLVKAIAFLTTGRVFNCRTIPKVLSWVERTEVGIFLEFFPCYFGERWVANAY